MKAQEHDLRRVPLFVYFTEEGRQNHKPTVSEATNRKIEPAGFVDSWMAVLRRRTPGSVGVRIFSLVQQYVLSWATNELLLE